MFSSPHGTTTFAQRHATELGDLLVACQDQGMMFPDVVEVGPGGVVSFLFEAMGKGKKSELDLAQRRRRYWVKRLETVLRRVPFMPLTSSESAEILEMLAPLKPKSLTVVDRENRVLRALHQSESLQAKEAAVSAHQSDIEKESSDISGDLVVAYCVVERCKDREAAMACLFSMVKPGGFLSTSYKHGPVPVGFSRVAEGLYLREAESARAIA